jgi:hypothetical protein
MVSSEWIWLRIPPSTREALGPGNHQIQIAVLGFAVGRVQQVLAVDVTDAGRTDRAIEPEYRDASAAEVPAWR